MARSDVEHYGWLETQAQFYFVIAGTKNELNCNNLVQYAQTMNKLSNQLPLTAWQQVEFDFGLMITPKAFEFSPSSRHAGEPNCRYYKPSKRTYGIYPKTKWMLHLLPSMDAKDLDGYRLYPLGCLGEISNIMGEGLFIDHKTGDVSATNYIASRIKVYDCNRWQCIQRPGIIGEGQGHDSNIFRNVNLCRIFTYRALKKTGGLTNVKSTVFRSNETFDEDMNENDNNDDINEMNDEKKNNSSNWCKVRI
jgi:hypothetical protein